MAFRFLGLADDVLPYPRDADCVGAAVLSRGVSTHPAGSSRHGEADHHHGCAGLPGYGGRWGDGVPVPLRGADDLADKMLWG